MKILKNKNEIGLLSLSLISIILIGVLSASIGGSTNYQLNLVKGTDEFTVEIYDDAAWKSTINSSSSPSDWFEGEANEINAKSKITLKGWTTNSWDTFDVLTSIFMPEYFSFGEILLLLNAMDSEGYNETTINNNYNYNYSLWYGLRAVWNYTTNDYEEKPSFNDGIIILQDPQDFKRMLDDYHLLAAELNGLFAIQILGYSFPNVSSDDFLWQLVFDGLAIAGPQNYYLETLINELGCENATISESTLLIKRYGLTNYTVEVSYGEKGMLSSFSVKDLNGVVIYQIISSNSEWLFYLIIIIVTVSSVAIVVFMIIRSKKLRK